MDWDEFAKGYNDLFLQDPLYGDILQRMVEEVAEVGGLRVLDLGCGTGNLITALLESCPGITVAGVDPSKGMRDECDKRLSDYPQVTICEGDALRIPFPDGSYDCITSSLALHHVTPDLKVACAAELARVLVPGGSFIHTDIFCGVPGSPGDPAWCRDIIDKFVAMALFDLDNGDYEMMLAGLWTLPRVLQGDGEYPMTVDEWRVILEAAGFTAFKVIDMSPIDLIKIFCCRRK